MIRFDTIFEERHTRGAELADISNTISPLLMSGRQAARRFLASRYWATMPFHDFEIF